MTWTGNKNKTGKKTTLIANARAEFANSKNATEFKLQISRTRVLSRGSAGNLIHVYILATHGYPHFLQHKKCTSRGT